MSAVPFYLASASPRRLALLRQIGVEPRVMPSRVDEAYLPGETAPAHVARLAELKARTVAASTAVRREPGPVLGADTEVVLDGAVLGKPRDDDDALRMLRSLNGKTHEVLTAVFLVHAADGRSIGGVETTRVRFRRSDEHRIRRYVESGEPLDKAGGYGIQGLGVLLVSEVRGSWSNVVGLPLERMPDWLGAIGVDPLGPPSR